MWRFRKQKSGICSLPAIGPWEELGSPSHSKGRSLEDLSQVASSVIWFLGNDCYCCVANGLDTGEWEVRRPAASFAQLRPDVTKIGGENCMPAETQVMSWVCACEGVCASGCVCTHVCILGGQREETGSSIKKRNSR